MGYSLAVGSGLVCLTVAAAAALLPGAWIDILSVYGTWAVPLSWEGTPVPLDGYTLVMGWSYGAVTAAAVALASLAASSASLGITMAAGRRALPQEAGAT